MSINYKSFIKSKIGSWLCQSLFVRRIILYLYIRQQNKRNTYLVPECVVDKYGMEKVKDMVLKHKPETGDLFIDQYNVGPIKKPTISQT